MDYQVSEQVRRAFDALSADARVQDALAFIREDQANVVERQIELTLIPAPTYHEAAKARRFVEMMKAEGLSECRIDEYGNAVGIRKGQGGGRTVLVEGHLDTVFPLDTKLEIVKEDGYIKCPGIVDDTSGLASALAVVRGLNAAGIQTKGDIHFIGTVEEEGTGGLMGMKYYIDHHPELQASISLDCDGWSRIGYQATGNQIYEVTFHGVGGHSHAFFGKMANPVHAAARAIAKIAEFQVPTSPRTSFAVTNLAAGAFENVANIPAEAMMRFSFRSDSQEELLRLRKQFFAAVEEACAEETRRWGRDTITYTVKHYVDINAGTQDAHAPIVEAAVCASEFLGDEASLASGGSANSNRAIEAGIPAVCLGDGRDYSPECHQLTEKFKVQDAYKGGQAALLLALMCAGTDAAESIID